MKKNTPFISINVSPYNFQITASILHEGLRVLSHIYRERGGQTAAHVLQARGGTRGVPEGRAALPVAHEGQGHMYICSTNKSYI